jgi:hypothetical protein
MHRQSFRVVSLTASSFVAHARVRRAAIQVGMHPPLEADGECTAGMPCIDHIEGYGAPTLLQVPAAAQNDGLTHLQTYPKSMGVRADTGMTAQAWASSH